MKNILIIVLISSGVVQAQEDIFLFGKDSLEYNAFKEHIPYRRMEKNWKFTPFDIIGVVPTFGVDLETKMSPGISFQFGAGIIPSFVQFIVGPEDDQFNSMNGYRLRFESRFWGFKKPNFYVSTEISFRHLIIQSTIPIGMEEDGNGNFAYFMNQDMLFHRFSTHFNAKVGWQKVFDSRLVLDLYLGFSLRRNNVLSNSFVQNAEGPQFNWNRFQWTLWDGHKFGYATPIVGFRIGFRVPAKEKL